ncbi:FAD-dependent oxidoreductase [Pseudorhodoferax sp.]|uniref:FAD-dependent oxidoreductase n=1 Tax=Pseudorhodoferax sp. TaxID=1993553 RepID=UPI002DD67682|nr:FAD-dependent oxidoreductase [Pseudorhodoferax sp.]
MKVAIIGSGPAGMFTAEFLAKDPATQVDIYERRLVPFGLLRYGVAPDHVGTKAIGRQFERTLTRPNVALACGVEVGTDLALADLLARYDHLVLASGSGPARLLPLDLPQVQEWTGLDLLRWMNGDPEVSMQPGAGIRRVLVIGHGNVSLDVVRLLAQAGPAAPTAAVAAIAEPAARWLHSLALEEIQVVGRGAAAHTRFSAQGLMELQDLERFVPMTEAAEVAETEGAGNADALAVLRSWAGQVRKDLRRPIRFGFGRSGMLGGGFVPDLVVHCVGQQVARIAGWEPMAWIGSLQASDHARVHAVGWAAGERAGAIPASRIQAKAAADGIRAKGLTQGPADAPSGAGPQRSSAAQV